MCIDKSFVKIQCKIVISLINTVGKILSYKMVLVNLTTWLNKSIEDHIGEYFIWKSGGVRTSDIIGTSVYSNITVIRDIEPFIIGDIIEELTISINVSGIISFAANVKSQKTLNRLASEGHKILTFDIYRFMHFNLDTLTLKILLQKNLQKN